jgi:holo-[acyl-carrier protein] synthase
MISAIGIDSVDVTRFSEWSSKPLTQLKKIFSGSEIDYCLKNTRLSAQRFAVRFAMREAFFKALCTMAPGHGLPFLKVCKTVQINHGENNVPYIQVNWATLVADNNKIKSDNIIVHVSLTHTNANAIAVVILETSEKI